MIKRIEWARVALIIVLFALIALTLFVSGCKKDKDPALPPGNLDENSLTVEFTATANGKTFHLGDTFTMAADSFDYKFDLLKFYVSQVILVKDDNTELLLKDIDMIDFRLDGPHVSFSKVIPAGEYKEIKLGIGVDSATNMKDPTTFGSTHPLALSKGTYWDMASQYRFFLMEGYLDTLRSDTTYTPFVVHTGTNALYRQKTFSKTLKFTKADHPKVYIDINIDALFIGANFRTDHSSHTMGSGLPLAQKIADNFINNLSLK